MNFKLGLKTADVNSWVKTPKMSSPRPRSLAIWASTPSSHSSQLSYQSPGAVNLDLNLMCNEQNLLHGELFLHISHSDPADQSLWNRWLTSQFRQLTPEGLDHINARATFIHSPPLFIYSGHQGSFLHWQSWRSSWIYINGDTVLLTEQTLNHNLTQFSCHLVDNELLQVVQLVVPLVQGHVSRRTLATLV